MRILHTSEFYPPSVGGVQEIVRRLSELLVLRGHEVTVATTRLPDRASTVSKGVAIEEFAISGNAVRGITGEVGRYQELLVNGGFDIVMNYAAQQWATDAAFPVLDRIPSATVLAPCGFSGLYDSAYGEYFGRLPKIMSAYDRLVVNSDQYRDAQFIRAAGLDNPVVIPNGAGTDEFGGEPSTSFRRSLGIAADVPLLVTVGSHTGMKGHAETLAAFRRARIGPAVFVVIGNTLDGRGCSTTCRARAAFTRIMSRGQKSVILLDPPRAEVVQAFREADLFVFGSLIECSPVVLIEAAAAGTPFISGPAGNAFEIAASTGGGVIIDGSRDGRGYVHVDVRAMALEIERLVCDVDERHRLGAAGHAAWRERFTWDRVATQWEDLYSGLLRKPTRA